MIDSWGFVGADAGYEAGLHGRGAAEVRGRAQGQRGGAEATSRRAATGAGDSERTRKSSGGSEERVPAGNTPVLLTPYRPSVLSVSQISKPSEKCNDS